MRILIDQDQVICKWLERVLEWYNFDRKTSYVIDDIKAWNVTDSLPNSHDFIRSCMRYPEFYRDLDPVEGAIAGMKKLVEAGHDVIIATAVPKSAGIAFHGKLEWIRRNMPWFDLSNFVAISRKSLLTGDILLDDGLHNIEQWMSTGRKAVVFDAPWNRSTILTVERVKHWNEFLQLLEKIDKKENDQESFDFFRKMNST